MKWIVDRDVSWNQGCEAAVSAPETDNLCLQKEIDHSHNIETDIYDVNSKKSDQTEDEILKESSETENVLKIVKQETVQEKTIQNGHIKSEPCEVDVEVKLETDSKKTSKNVSEDETSTTEEVKTELENEEPSYAKDETKSLQKEENKLILELSGPG